MADQHLIGPVPLATPAKTASSRGPRRTLPADLLRDTSRRLGIISLVGSGLWTLASALGHLAVRSTSHGDPQWRRLGGPDAIAAVSVIVSPPAEFVIAVAKSPEFAGVKSVGTGMTPNVARSAG